MLVSAVSNSRNSSNVAFKGNLATLVSKEVLHSKAVDEAALTIAKKAKGIVNKVELPVTKNPVVAPFGPVVTVIITVADKALDKTILVDPTPASLLAKGALKIIKWLGGS